MNRPFHSLLFAILAFLSLPAIAGAPSLIDAQWLKTNQDQSDLVVLDIQAPKEYQRFHIPGAVNAPYDRWRTQPPKQEGKAARAKASELDWDRVICGVEKQLQNVIRRRAGSENRHETVVATTQ